MTLWLLWVGLGAAELPPPPYDQVLARREWVRVYDTLQDGDPEGARQQARAYQQTVQQTAGLQYLIGRASLELSDLPAARDAFQAAVALDPGHTPSWLQLGDIALASGDLDLATTAFTAVSEGQTMGRDAWLGPLRLCEVAAMRGDVDAFEDQLREAIQRGFELASVVNDARWHAFYADERLTDSLRKMLVVYADERTRDRFDRGIQGPL